ncbi:hypothetical protein [Guptibacillus algicola]|uniref:hypothetical protein n=1 Tax=Guptibacillus algicola TaxID=225844 RepID=UPI001CD1ADCC|nr:hypothetical protein [Alkalihalobacillus algicola]MCA0987259.1 hypothetical protein [Alkalihalobacillus algicola]
MGEKKRVTLENMLKGLVVFQKIWLTFIISLIVISLFVLFLLSFIFQKDITLTIMNGWVSLILGLVATTLSIISTIVSFYNLERTNEINEENIKTMLSLFNTNKETVASLEILKKDLEKFADDIPKRTAKEIEGSLQNNPRFDEDELPF